MTCAYSRGREKIGRLYRKGYGLRQVHAIGGYALFTLAVFNPFYINISASLVGTKIQSAVTQTMRKTHRALKRKKILIFKPDQLYHYTVISCLLLVFPEFSEQSYSYRKT